MNKAMFNLFKQMADLLTQLLVEQKRTNELLESLIVDKPKKTEIVNTATTGPISKETLEPVAAPKRSTKKASK